MTARWSGLTSTSATTTPRPTDTTASPRREERIHVLEIIQPTHRVATTNTSASAEAYPPRRRTAIAMTTVPPTTATTTIVVVVIVQCGWCADGSCAPSASTRRWRVLASKWETQRGCPADLLSSDTARICALRETRYESYAHAHERNHSQCLSVDLGSVEADRRLL
jgi:hypothetical protein